MGTRRLLNQDVGLIIIVASSLPRLPLIVMSTLLSLPRARGSRFNNRTHSNINNNNTNNKPPQLEPRVWPLHMVPGWQLVTIMEETLLLPAQVSAAAWDSTLRARIW